MNNQQIENILAATKNKRESMTLTLKSQGIHMERYNAFENVHGIMINSQGDIVGFIRHYDILMDVKWDAHKNAWVQDSKEYAIQPRHTRMKRKIEIREEDYRVIIPPDKE